MNVPFTIWLTDGFFRQIPKEMSEVARTDGCTRLQAFWNVELPLAGPGIGAAAIDSNSSFLAFTGAAVLPALCYFFYKIKI